ncbi:hypothetical protein Tco_0887704 [Tanacetum coccineum]
MASNTTPPPSSCDHHIVIYVGVTINVPTSIATSQQAPLTVVWTSQTGQDASIQTQDASVDETQQAAAPLSARNPPRDSPSSQNSGGNRGAIGSRQALAREKRMAHHSVVGAKASRLWLTTPLNSGAIPNLVPNSIFLTFFSMARAYPTTTPSALRLL